MRRIYYKNTFFFFELCRSIQAPQKWSKLVTCCHVSVLCPWRCRNVNSPVAGIRIQVAVVTAVSHLPLELEAPVINIHIYVYSTNQPKKIQIFITNIVIPRVARTDPSNMIYLRKCCFFLPFFSIDNIMSQLHQDYVIT